MSGAETANPAERSAARGSGPIHSNPRIPDMKPDPFSETFRNRSLGGTAVFLALACFGGLCATTEAAYITRQLTATAGKSEDHIRISGSRAVWQRKFSSDFEIYAYDGSGVLQLTNNGTDDSEPEISGDRVVYLGGPDVMCYDFSTGATTNLSNDAGWQRDPRIDGNWVYWFEWDAAESNVELVRLDLATGTRTNISDNAVKNDHNSQSNFNILGDRAVWIAWNGASSQIHFNDGAATRILGADPGTTYFKPCVTSTHVVWLESSALGNFIAVHDGSVTTRIDVTIESSVEDLRAGASGICLTRSNPGTVAGSTQLDTFLFDPATLAITTVADGPTHEQYPEMGDGVVVWAQDAASGTDAYIMVRDLATGATEEVSEAVWHDGFPEVSGRNVLWSGYDFGRSGEVEVFIAYWLGAGAMLSGVDLSGEDLSGLLFTGADLRGAVLTGATLDSGALAGATIDAATLFPDGADFTATTYDLSGIALPSAFADWMAGRGLAGAGGLADSDGDGSSNLLEFALGGDAAAPGVLPVMRAIAGDGDSDGQDEFQLLLAVRRGAEFGAAGSGALGADIDGIRYRVEGTANLTDYFEDLVFVGRADTAPTGSGLPDLGGTGWEYARFRFSSPPSSGRGFMRVEVTEQP